MVSAHAYPWDVVGDPNFAARCMQLGVPSVTLAVTYHSTRAATPNHPSHRYIDAQYAALYRPVRERAWKGKRLVPLGPKWMAGPDPAGHATQILNRAGIPVTAWIVLAHNTRLGLAYPDLTVVNCFGDRYPYALCPSQGEVREHCVTLAAEALRDLPVDGVSLESVGQMGAVHLGCHEKTDGAYTPQALRALSVCCCTACMDLWAARDLSPQRAIAALRSGTLPPEIEAIILDSRQEATDALRRAVIYAVRQQAPGLPITLHAHPDPWATGPSPGLTPTAAAEVDRLLVPCWPTTEASAELVTQAKAHHGEVDAYVTALPPADPQALPEHIRRLRAAGATRVSLYHLGLVPPHQQNLLAHMASEARA